MSRLVFWVAVAMIMYTYAVYPALVALLGRWRPHPVVRGPIRPPVSILVVAYNEAAGIARKIENCLALDYPRDRLEVVIASDGSTDDTEAIARNYDSPGVSVVAFGVRRGKPSVLNAIVPKLNGDIVLLADARQTFDRDVLTALVDNFADPQVGGVSGELIIRNVGEAAVGEGVGFYWRYEKAIRYSESRYDSSVGATGAIYAIRRELFEPIPEDTILDDVVIPMLIVRRGYRVLFEPAAQAFDTASVTARQEFARKVRTIAGNFQMFVSHPWLLSPTKNRLWVQTVSHKGLRLLGPALLIAIFAANLTLLDRPLYVATLAFQVVFYLAACVGHVLGARGQRSRWLTVPYAFCFLNVITVISFYRFATGRQGVTWVKTRR